MTSSPRFLIPLFALATSLSLATGLLGAQAYIIVDGKSGYVFQEHDAKKKRQVGSLTKVATAMVVLDWAEKHGGDLGQIATVPPEAFTGVTENLIGFQPGDSATLRDLLYAALVQSDNIAAYTLASHVGEALRSIVPSAGNDAPVMIFVSQMNALAKNLRMDRTLFVNPHGIDAGVKPVPYSTAMDMARLTRYAIGKPGFRFYVSQKERQIAFTRAAKPQNYMLRNTNELLGVDGVDGVKTGRTARAGDCLILSAQRPAEIQRAATSTIVFPRNLIVVLLASPNRFEEGRQLLGTGWQLHERWVAGGRLVDPKKTL